MIYHSLSTLFLTMKILKRGQGSFEEGYAVHLCRGIFD